MSNDPLFRWILLGGFLLLLPVGVYHRVRSHTGEPLDRRQEGMFMLVTLRLGGLVGFAGLIGYLIDPASMRWAAVPLPTPWRWIGVGVGVLAVFLLIWTLRTLGGNLTDTVVTRQAHTLVTTGPYRWVRHPFYCTAGLLTITSTLVAANAFFLGIGTLLLVLLATEAVASRGAGLKPVALLGHETLQVFCLHLLLLYGGVVSDAPPLLALHDALGFPGAFATLVALLPVLYAAAAFWQRVKQRAPHAAHLVLVFLATGFVYDFLTRPY